MSSRLGQAFKLVLASTTGKGGLTLLAVLVLVSAYVLVSYPLDFGTTRWSAPLEWADNPKVVPPTWVNLLPGQDRVLHTVLKVAEPAPVREAGPASVSEYPMPLSYHFDEPPTFISFTVSDVSFYGRSPLITLLLSRPDGERVTLYRYVPPGLRPGEEAPASRHGQEPLRVLLSADDSVRTALTEFHNRRYDAGLSERELRSLVDHAVFGVPVPGGGAVFQTLPGDYRFLAQVTTTDPRDSVGAFKVVVGGDAFGLMGTDSLGRDLAVGLLFGFPVALFIGLMASTLSTATGASLGIASGYMGGWVDALIQRLADIVANIPLLPILIFMVFIFGSNLLLIILLLVAFSWPGLTIVVRSMVLQLRTGQFVEASLALGASRRRIMLRHIFPQVAPFVLAQMIFFTPAAILAEAGLSFLGLGDPSIPTWGQILEQGFRTGAVYVGHWWWVLPPGLLIIVTSVTFALLALALEPVVNPRLRGRS